MDKKFLMGVGDWLTRSNAAVDKSTYVSPRLRKNLIMAAISRSYDFYSNFFEIPVTNIDFEKLAAEYERHYLQAISLGMFAVGGIREKDHLNFWCLSQLFSPEVYVESGVFIGSSLHAFINSPAIKKIFAIDPNLSKLRIPRESIPGAELIDSKDFSQIDFTLSGMKSLVYFDDHIDTARRIIQASEKGFRYLLFDDSTGLEGICQRLYPAIPTIPMIMNADILNPGDELAWTFGSSSINGVRGFAKNIIRGKSNMAATRLNLSISQELIEECFEAKKLIKKYRVISNLGEFIPPQYPERMVDTSKYLVELHQR
ncbi:MAG: hypothetical protein F6K10_18195 [Moorea sp. SIO2B7]|nr:hypothetical protein [Moorena sp. SIO2B7]